MSEATQPAADRPRSRRSGRGGGGRGRGHEPAEPTEPQQPEAPPAPAPEPATSGFSLGGAFDRLKQAVGRIGGDEAAETEESPPAPRPPDAEEEDDIPMPASSAPPPPYSTPSSLPGGIPVRSARFRRGSRGGARRPGAGGGLPEIPKIGVVEVDPNFRPRGDVMPVPPKPPMVGGQPSGAGAGAQERGERGGRGRGPRRFESETMENTNHDARPALEQVPPPEPPERSAPEPPAAPAADTVESLWSKVKRGLTGGT